MPLRIGSAFELHQPVARGGMGEVWRATHVPSTALVAIKVAIGDVAKDPEFAAHFRNEVHAAAALDHPYLIRLFDHGVVGADLAAQSEGRLEEGTPWMAMEWASLGPLRLSTIGRWSHLRRVLLALLDALAHAHARGVVHRDIKPSNVVICGDDAPRPGLKLADFGIAARREAEGETTSAGTRYYAAPEQLEGRFRDQGPWTDLYSLGCLALAVATGWKRLLSAKEPLIARFPVPAGFAGWVRRLTAQDERARWPFAADAARALVGLGDVEEDDLLDHVSLPIELGSGLQTLAELPTEMTGTPTLTTGAGWAAPTAITLAEIPLPVNERPAFVAQWRRPDPPRPPAWLEGVGLGLFGLRTPPFVGRELARQKAWDALADVISTGRARTLVITGPSGCGRSRLAAWLLERAHELGMATSMVATHGAQRSRHDGLTPMVARSLRCQGLSRAAALLRIGSALRTLGADEPGETMALCELIVPATEHDLALGSPRIRLESRSERQAIIRRYVSRVARARAAIVWIDDVSFGPDAVAFVRALIASQHEDPAPVLVVVTSEPPTTEELLALEGAEELALEALSKNHLTQLVRGLLGLSPRFVARAQELSGGNPLNAVQLVGEWVARDILELGEGGFVVREGVATGATDDLFAARLAAADPDASEALEIAATLGLYVSWEEWALACECAGLETNVGMVDALVAAGLARRDEERFSFAFAGVRDSLARRAASLGRTTEHHSACARALTNDPSVDAMERCATHWIAAGDHERALDPLDRAIKDRLSSGAHRLAETYLSLRKEAVEAMALPPGDRRLAVGAVLEATLRIYLSELDEAERVLAPWLADIESFRGDPIFVDILNAVGRAGRVRGDLKRSMGQLAVAEEAAKELGDRARLADIRRLLADVALVYGDLDRAEAWFVSGQVEFNACNDTLGMAHCVRGRAMVARMREQYELTQELLEQAVALFAEVGSRGGMAGSANDLADNARYRGNLEEAERGYRDALRTFRSMESTFGIYAEANLALVLVARKQYEEADELLRGVQRRTEREGRRDLEAIVQTCLMPCAAGLGAWPLFDARIERAEELLARTGRIDVEVALLAVSTASICRGAEEWARAERCDEIAIAQWTALDRLDEVAAVRRSAQRLQ